MSLAQLAESLVQEAKRVIQDPWLKTDEEKLELIKSLSMVDSAESVRLLSSFLDMVKLPLKTEHEAQNMPRGGVISVEAAHSLAVMKRLDALRILESNLLDYSKHEFLREAIVLGLAGLTDTVNYRLLLQALKDPDTRVRRAAIQSISKTIQGFQKHNMQIPYEVLKALLEYAYVNDLENAHLNGKLLARHIIIYNMNNNVEDELVRLMRESKDLLQILALADTLRGSSSDEAISAILSKFNQKGLEANVYGELALILMAYKKPEISKIAELISKERDSLMFVRSLFNKGYKRSFIARKRAAFRIMKS